MIQLQLKIDPLPIGEPMVLRLRTGAPCDPLERNGRDANLVSRDEISGEFDILGFSLKVYTSDLESLNGDVVLILPGRQSLHRLIRGRSRHNTLLITEQCDQICIMCSQPPKSYHNDMFDSFLEAIALAPRDATIGLSGGEPFLHKSKVFNLIGQAQRIRPDIKLHILTNGQHFDKGDVSVLEKLDLSSILWGIPIYSASSTLHDKIVGKAGAFEVLQNSIALLGALGAGLELRTVIMNSNVGNLGELADHITTHQSFASVWAIMQLENIGFARMNWTKEFYDNSRDFDPIARGIDLATARGMTTSLYNFPLCTVPQGYRTHCVASISDWKQKFLVPCDGCGLKSRCGGFFQWYPENRGFTGIAAQ